MENNLGSPKSSVGSSGSVSVCAATPSVDGGVRSSAPPLPRQPASKNSLLLCKVAHGNGGPGEVSGGGDGGSTAVRGRNGGSVPVRKLVRGAKRACVGDVFKCCECTMVFRTVQSLCGHMNRHPNRGWRGLRPPMGFRCKGAQMENQPPSPEEKVVFVPDLNEPPPPDEEE